MIITTQTTMKLILEDYDQEFNIELQTPMLLKNFKSEFKTYLPEYPYKVYLFDSEFTDEDTIFPEDFLNVCLEPQSETRNTKKTIESVNLLVDCMCDRGHSRRFVRGQGHYHIYDFVQQCPICKTRLIPTSLTLSNCDFHVFNTNFRTLQPATVSLDDWQFENFVIMLRSIKNQ